MCVCIYVYVFGGGRILPCVVWEVCDRRAPEHDAQSCWTEFSPFAEQSVRGAGSGARTDMLQ